MLYNDHSGSLGSSYGQHGYSGATSEVKGLISKLAQDIERSLGAQRRDRSYEATGPWDSQSADALMRVYETAEREDIARARPQGSEQMAPQNFASLALEIQKALDQSKTSEAVGRLEQRFSQFQSHIAGSLEDVMQRADSRGIHEIQSYVADLGQRVVDVQIHMSKLESIEASLGQLLYHQAEQRLDQANHFAATDASLERVAMRAAEEVRGHYANDAMLHAGAHSQHYDDLRSLIETSIQEMRRVEAQQASVVNGLGGAVGQQSVRHDELKRILDAAMRERRQHEEQASMMMVTMQQALMRVLDRIEAIDLNRTQVQRPVMPAQPERRTDAPIGGSLGYEPSMHFSSHDAFMARPSQVAAAAQPQAKPAQPAPQLTAIDGGKPHSVRDFVAEAQAAKAKAAMRAEVRSGATVASRMPRPQASNPIPRASMAREALTSRPMMAAGLALAFALNVGFLLMSRETPVAPIAIAPELMQPEAAATQPTQVPALPSATPAREQAANANTDFAMDGGGEHPDVKVAPADAHAPVEAAPATADATAPAQPDTDSQPALAAPAHPAAITDANFAEAALAEVNGQASPAKGDDGAAIEPQGPTPAGVSKQEDLPPATVGPLSLRLAASKGDASAEFEVASRLAEGKGTAQNFQESVRWYQRSASRGFAQAQYRLGTLYERGLGVKKDLARAKVWYKRAAEGGNVKSMHNLAVLSAGGEGAEPNYAEASQWFIKASERGLADSQYNLAVLYENGLGVDLDPVTAYKWFALAANGGDKDAVTRRDALKEGLSAGDRKKAEALVKSFKANTNEPLANDPRVAGEDWKKRAETASNNG